MNPKLHELILLYLFMTTLIGTEVPSGRLTFGDIIGFGDIRHFSLLHVTHNIISVPN